MITLESAILFDMEYEDIVSIAASNMPYEFRDDAIQAGYIGLLNGLKNKDKVKTNLRGYLYRCVINEMIKELGKLHRPFSLNSKLFNRLLKYKKEKGMGLNKLFDPELEQLLSIKQWSYMQYGQD